MTTILITGGGRGLGRATAAQLAAAGHLVLLAARTRSRDGFLMHGTRAAPR